MSEELNIDKPEVDEVATTEPTRCGCYYRPYVDIIERSDELVVVADVPGADPEKIDIDFEDHTLSILAKVPPRREEGAEYDVQEYGMGDYFRTFQVSEAIDPTRISAECADGVLTLHLPKVEAARPRKIPVVGG